MRIQHGFDRRSGLLTLMQRLTALLLLSTAISCATFNDPVSDGIRSGQARIFVTSASYVSGGLGLNADLDPLTTADNTCTTAAAQAGLTLNYKAVLSLSTKNAVARFGANTGKVFAFDSASSSRVVVENLSDLFKGASTALLSAIDMDETYISQSGGNAWTGTTTSGIAMSNCTDWTVGGMVLPKSGAGDIGSLTGGWLNRGVTLGCNATLHLYCIGER